jgi:hypothetical protein
LRCPENIRKNSPTLGWFEKLNELLYSTKKTEPEGGEFFHIFSEFGRSQLIFLLSLKKIGDH